MEEYFFTCPYCFSEVSIMIDPSIPKQEYIEDCERCCNPIEFQVVIDDEGEVEGFSAEPIGQ